MQLIDLSILEIDDPAELTARMTELRDSGLMVGVDDSTLVKALNGAPVASKKVVIRMAASNLLEQKRQEASSNHESLFEFLGAEMASILMLPIRSPAGIEHLKNVTNALQQLDLLVQNMVENSSLEDMRKQTLGELGEMGVELIKSMKPADQEILQQEVPISARPKYRSQLRRALGALVGMAQFQNLDLEDLQRKRDEALERFGHLIDQLAGEEAVALTLLTLDESTTLADRTNIQKALEKLERMAQFKARLSAAESKRQQLLESYPLATRLLGAGWAFHTANRPAEESMEHLTQVRNLKPFEALNALDRNLENVESMLSEMAGKLEIQLASVRAKHASIEAEYGYLVPTMHSGFKKSLMESGPDMVVVEKTWYLLRRLDFDEALMAAVEEISQVFDEIGKTLENLPQRVKDDALKGFTSNTGYRGKSGRSDSSRKSREPKGSKPKGSGPPVGRANPTGPDDPRFIKRGEHGRDQRGQVVGTRGAQSRKRGRK